MELAGVGWLTPRLLPAVWYSHFSNAGAWYQQTLGGEAARISSSSTRALISLLRSTGLCGIAILSTVVKLLNAGIGGMLFDGATLSTLRTRS